MAKKAIVSIFILDSFTISKMSGIDSFPGGCFLSQDFDRLTHICSYVMMICKLFG